MYSAHLKTTKTNPNTLQLHSSRHESDDFSIVPPKSKAWLDTMDGFSMFNLWLIKTGWWLGHPSEKYEFVNWDD